MMPWSRSTSRSPTALLGMRWQITILLVITQLAAHVATIIILTPTIRSDARQQDYALDMGDPLLLLLPLLPTEATSLDPIPQAVVAADPRFDLRARTAPEEAPELVLIQNTLRAAAPDAWAERLLFFRADWGGRPRGPIAEPFYVAIDLADGRQLVFEPELSRLAATVPRVVLTLGLMLIAMPIMILSVWAGHVIVRPIAHMADGADAFARDIHAPHIGAVGAPEVRRAVRSVNDMRDRIQTLLRTRSMTLAAISHDMRTPLTRMRLRLEKQDAPGLEPLKKDLAELERMTDDALKFLRAEEEVAALRPTDIAVLCKTVCDEFGDQGAKTSYTGQDHLVSNCDPAFLRRVLENTIGNALKHAGSCTVRLSPPTRDGADLTLEVIDTGPGIAEDQFETVLRPFSRLEAVQAGGSGSVGGFGLGLAISKLLMTRQSGTLSLRSNAPTGLIVRLTLPSAPQGV